MAVKLTDQQLGAVEDRGGNLLVSSVTPEEFWQAVEEKTQGEEETTWQ